MDVNIKEYLSQFQTETFRSPVAVIFRDEEGFFDKEIVDELAVDFERASNENPNDIFGVIGINTEGEVKLSVFKEGKDVFDKTENKFETKDDASLYFEAMLEYGAPEKGTDDYEKMKEEFELTEKYAVELEDGEVEYFKDEETAKDFVKIEKETTGSNLEVRSTLEPVSEHKFIEKEAVLETKNDLLNEKMEELLEEKGFYEGELDKAQDAFEDKRYNYIRDVYNESDNETKEYLLNEDKDFKGVVEGLEDAKSKIDELEQKIDSLKTENPDLFEKDEDSPDVSVESDDDVDAVEDLDDSQEDVDDYDDDYDDDPENL